MSRVSIMQDTAALICGECIHGYLRKADKQIIYDIVFVAIPNRARARQMIREIAYRIGYANSKLAKYMSEVTYKKKKQWIRNLIAEELSERGYK